MTTRLTAPVLTRSGVRATAQPSRLDQRRASWQGWGRRGVSRCGALVLAVSLVLVVPAAASAKVFLELPGVPGESQVAGLENQIELDSFQFGVRNPVQMGLEKVK